MTALHANPLFTRLESAESVLVAGAGGGFDIYAGLPVALSLLHQGKRVQLANLSLCAAAIQGSFGNVQFNSRTRGSELFVNPLMSLCFTFELEGVARRCLYLDRIENTHLIRQVSSAIELFREEIRTRAPRRIPH